MPLHPQRGRQRPEAPAADPGRRLELGGLGRGARVEEGDGRAGRLAALVDRRERRPVAVDADGDDVERLAARVRVAGAPQVPDGRHDGRPPGVGILLGPARPVAHVEAIAGPGDRHEPPIEGDEARLHLGRPEVDAEDDVGHGWRPSPPTSVARSSSTTASAVATSVTSVRTTPARSAPRIGDLALARGDADRDRHPAEGPGIEREHPLAELRRDEAAIEVERRDEDLADGVRCIELPGDPLADRGGAPRRAADAEQGDVEPGPQVEDRADAGVRLERGSWSPRRRAAPAP